MLALIPFLPLLGFLINGIWYAFFETGPGQKKRGATLPGVIATLAIFSAFVVSLSFFVTLWGLPEASRSLEQNLFSWMTVGSFQLDVAFRFDTLSSLFCLVITGIGTLIHIYSMGYMAHDESPAKFFSYLNLFCFAMLVLVLGASLPMLFFGWEGVGLCSYLLIGFWYGDEEKAKAGKKAFIVNRIGDFGFLIGMFLIFTAFNTLDFAQSRSAMMLGAEHGGHFALPPGVSEATVTAICLLLFVGCMGKSAQIPLYVWLPDAMAGPTPVSALIHAATMVTSGIYMVSRLNFLFSMSHTAMMVVACVGAFTAFFAATIAFVQTDIKKVLAYSTVSQLGYMFLGCGVGAYAAGVFHVITHAFFKALLFLGAGSVIHGMHHEQDILKMGGLRSKMPWTFLTFFVGWLAICGIPPFSGFFSKDEILWSAFSSEHGSKVLWFLAALTAVMTAFYMTRLFVLTFLGKPRFEEAAGHGHHDDHGHGHGHGVHESPFTMVFPLIVLAVLSAVGGFMGFPHHNWLAGWLSPIIPEHAAPAGVNPSMEWVLMGVSVAGAVLGIAFAFNVFKGGTLERAKGLKENFKGLHQSLLNKWYVDELYEAVFVKPIHGFSKFLWKGVDVLFVDKTVMSFGWISSWTGQAMRVLQTGSIHAYGLGLLLGLLITVGYLMYAMV